MANRSSSFASTVPSASAIVDGDRHDAPVLGVDTPPKLVAVTVNWAAVVGIGVSRCAAWSRCTRLSRPSTTGMPSSVTAAPMAANTAGQQWPTSASGTRVRPGASGCAERRGDTGVVGDLLGIPLDVDRRGVVVHRRQCVGTVDACGDREHRAHRRRCVLDGDDRHTAVDGAGRQREADVDPDSRQRHAQRDNAVGVQLEPRTGGRVCGAAVFVGLPLVAAHRCGAPG